MTSITPFRITPEDLADLKAETREGLMPLLDALNVTLQELVAAAAATPTEEVVSVYLQTDTAVSTSFPLVFKTSVPRPTWVGMVCVPKDQNHSLTTPFVMQGFQLTDAGLVSVPWITGLLAFNGYNLTFFVR